MPLHVVNDYIKVIWSSELYRWYRRNNHNHVKESEWTRTLVVRMRGKWQVITFKIWIVHFSRACSQRYISLSRFPPRQEVTSRWSSGVIMSYDRGLEGVPATGRSLDEKLQRPILFWWALVSNNCSEWITILLGYEYDRSFRVSWILWPRNQWFPLQPRESHLTWSKQISA